MDYSKLSDEELLALKNKDYSKLSNETLLELKNEQTQEQEQQAPLKAGVSIDVTPSGLYKGSQNVIGSAIAAPFVAKRDNISVKDAFNQNMDKVREYRKENPTPVQDFLVDLGAYSLIPQTNLLKGAGVASKLGNFAINAGLQGGIPGLLEGLKQGNGGQGALLGTGIAAGIQGLLPPIARGVGTGMQKIAENPNVQKGVARVNEFLTSIPEKYTDLAIKAELAGKSLLKDKFDPATAYQGIERKLRTAKEALPTKQQYQKQYKGLGQKVREKLDKTIKPESYYNEQLYNEGRQALKNIDSLDKKMAERVAEAVENLPADTKFSAKELKQIIDDVYNSYSVSGKKAYSPAFNNGGDKLYNELMELVENKKGGQIENYKNALDNLKYPNGKLETVKNRYKNRYHSKTLDSLENNITMANRRFNDEILGNLKEHPEWLTDPKKIEALENQISSYSVPEEYQQEMFGRLYEAVGKADLLQNQLTPKEMVDLYRTIGEKPNWEAPNEKTKNEILQTIYGRFSNLTKGLSPQLKEANDFFTKYMELKKNTGGLNPSTIASKLKNYGSDSQILSGADKAIRDIDSLLQPEQRFLGNVQNINKELANQKQLINNLPEAVLNDISKYNNAPLEVQNALEKFAPDELNTFRNAYNAQTTQDNILKSIVGQQYERNPRLLANRNDLGAEEALEYLQDQSGINFMDELNNIRAREAFDKWTPGQGGGYGSDQGFANKIRGAILTTLAGVGGATGGFAGATTLPVLGSLAFSPRITGQGLIKGLGGLQNIGNKLIDGNGFVGDVTRRVLPASLIAPWE